MEADMNFSVLDLAAKCSSKSELYTCLTTAGKMYLPPKQDSTRIYLKGIMHGTKKYIKTTEVRVIQVPQYENLRVKDILEFTEEHLNITEYLPEYEYDRKPTRQWLCNLVNSLLPEEFEEFMALRIKQRTQKLIRSKNLGMTVNPELMEMFKNYEGVSYQKGRSHFLTRNPKPSKDKRKVEQLEEEKESVEKKTHNLERKLNELVGRLDEYQRADQDNIENLRKLNELFEMGVINNKGEYKGPPSDK